MCYKKKTFIILLFLNGLTNKNTCRRIQSFTEFFFYGSFKIFYIFLHSFFLINFNFYYNNAFFKYNRFSINFVTFISFPMMATNTVIDTISVGLSPDQVTIIPDGTRAYVTNQASNTVSVIDIATNTVITNIPVGVAPTGIATGTICE